jgi:carboxymethylenebutenolidase
VYEGAGHAFFADYRPSYRSEPAALLWERVVPFFADHLRGEECR